MSKQRFKIKFTVDIDTDAIDAPGNMGGLILYGDDEQALNTLNHFVSSQDDDVDLIDIEREEVNSVPKSNQEKDESLGRSLRLLVEEKGLGWLMRQMGSTESTIPLDLLEILDVVFRDLENG